MIKLNGDSLTTDKVLKVAEGEKVEISKESKEKISESRELLEDLFNKGVPIYGTTTGIGELANIVLSKKDAKIFQKKLVYSHAAGYGDPLPPKVVKAAILARLNTLCKGMSGIRLEVAEKMKEILNSDITPVMYPASVGACGDLAPLAQAMLVLIGEGEVIYKGRRMKSKTALKMKKIKPVEFEVRDGLASINGSQLICGWGALLIEDILKLIKTSEIISAVTLDSLLGLPDPFRDELVKSRGFAGAVETAKNIRSLRAGTNMTGDGVQDAYSLRSIPQVIGAVRDARNFAKSQIEIELNGAADNPVFIPGKGYFTGANFQGTPTALPLEMLTQGVTILSVMSERRINRLTNPALNKGLPGFLCEKPGLNSGIMIPQYTAAYLVNENRILSYPAVTGSIPTAADQEDFVSMGTNTVVKLDKIVKNTYAVIAIEAISSAQALELRLNEGNYTPGKGVKLAFKFARKYVKFLDEDRPLYKDIKTMTDKLIEGRIIKKIERKMALL